MHPKEADAMANSVDPDQTASSEAVWSWSALFAETYLSQYNFYGTAATSKWPVYPIKVSFQSLFANFKIWQKF